MTRIFGHIAAAVFIAIAVFQAFTVLDQYSHAAILAWKVGYEPALITAGTTMLVVFFAASAAFIGIGFVIVRYAPPELRRAVRIATWSLAVAAVAWGALVLSRVVAVVPR